MATILKASGAILPAAGAKFALIPHADKCEGLFIMGGTIDDCCRNLIKGKPDATAVGSPTVADRYIETTGAQTHYLQTSIAHAQDVTMIAVARALSDTNSMIMGNYQSVSQAEPAARTYGTALSFAALTAANNKLSARFGHGWTSGAAGNHNASNVETTETVDVGKDLLVSGWIQNSAWVKTVRNETDGILGNQAPDVAKTADLGQPYRIGSSYDAAFPAKTRIYAALICNTMLSAQERASIFVWLRAYYLNVWGIVI